MYNEKELSELYEKGHSLEELISIFGDSQELREIYVNSALMRRDFEVIREALIEKKKQELFTECRDKVRNSPEKNYYPKEGDMLMGYVYEEDGRYHKYYLNANADNIAKFICSSDKDKFICTPSDYALMNTICGTYLDLSCAHAKYTSKVVESLIKYQKMMAFQTFQEYDFAEG